MSGQRSNRFLPLEKLAQEKENRAEKEYADQLRNVAKQEQRLKELESYMEEYLSAPGGGISPLLLQNRFAFIAKLREAVMHQSFLVDQAKAVCKKSQESLVSASHESMKMGKLVDQYAENERQTQERRAQGEIDDIAARVVAVNKNNAGESNE